MRMWKSKEEEEEDATFLSRCEGSSNPAFVLPSALRP